MIEAVSAKFASFTLHETTGYFKGRPEKSIVLEIIEARDEEVEAVARAIRAINGQKSVVMMSLPRGSPEDR